MGVITDKDISIYDLPPHLRPALGYKNDVTLPVRRTGVLPFLRQGNDIYVLLQCKTCNGLFEDFGGGIDFSDTDLVQAAAREAHEESNGILNEKEVAAEINEDFCEFYVRGKFCLFFLEITAIHPSVFGNIETHDKIPRTCHWVRLDTVRKYNLNPRLRYSNFDQTLSELI